MRAYVFRITKNGKSMYPVAVMALNYNDAINQIQKAGVDNYNLIHITNPTPKISLPI
jgi:hypothetical protein